MIASIEAPFSQTPAWRDAAKSTRWFCQGMAPLHSVILDSIILEAGLPLHQTEAVNKALRKHLAIPYLPSSESYLVIRSLYFLFRSRPFIGLWSQLISRDTCFHEPSSSPIKKASASLVKYGWILHCLAFSWLKASISFFIRSCAGVRVARARLASRYIFKTKNERYFNNGLLCRPSLELQLPQHRRRCQQAWDWTSLVLGAFLWAGVGLSVVSWICEAQTLCMGLQQL